MDGARRSGEEARIFADLPELETDRLLLRKMRLEDAEAMFAYASDPEVTRYVLWDTHGSIEEYENFHWCRGLMPEAVRRVIHFCFERMELNRVEARCIAENTASARVM